MIVLSGVLLVLAVIFLVIGLFAALGWVYAAIAASLVAFVFLLIGVRQRQDVLPAAQGFPRATPEAGPAASQPAADSGDVTIVASAAPAVTPEPESSEPDTNVDEGITLIPPASPLRDDAVPDTPPEPARPRASSPTARKRTPAVPPASTKPPAAKRATPAKKAAVRKPTAAKPPAKQAQAPAAAPAKQAAPVKKAPAKRTPAAAPVTKAAKATAKKAAPAAPVKKTTKRAPAAGAAAKRAAAEKTTAKQTPATRSATKRTIASETEFLLPPQD